ncbi:MAG: hypothetical protein RSC43_07210 [Clostridia bacterium]
MITNSREQGNTIFHIATNPDGTLQPIINVPLTWSNQGLLLQLMSTENIGIHKLVTTDNRCFMILFDDNRKRPYPSAMIWRFICQGEDRLIIDVEKEDMDIISFVASNYLAK